MYLPLIVAILIIIIGLLDCHSTARALSRRAIEANPWQRRAQEVLGDTWPVLYVLFHLAIAFAVTMFGHWLPAVAVIPLLGWRLVVIRRNYRL